MENTNSVIVKVPLPKVQKHKVSGLVKKAVTIVGKYDPAALHIENTYNLVVENLPLLDKLEVVYRKHPKTEVLDEIRIRRNNLIKAILKHTKALQDAKIPAQVEQLKLIVALKNHFLRDILKKDMKSKSDYLSQFFITIDTDAPLNAALTALGYSVFLTELRGFETNFDVTFDIRNLGQSKIPKMETKQVKKSTSLYLRNLVKVIEAASIEHPELDYKPLMNELNTLFVSYNTEIKVAATIKKTRLLISKTKTATATTLTSDTVAV